MQPAVMSLLHAMAEVLKCDGVIEDTHAKDMYRPDCRPDICCLASSVFLQWGNVNWVEELKLGTSEGEVMTMHGQLIQRSAAALSHQPERPLIIGLGMTMNAFEASAVEPQLRPWLALPCSSLTISLCHI